MLRSLARFNGSEPLIHTRSSAASITSTAGFRFSVHTTVCDRCGGLSIKIVDPGKPLATALVQCARCDALRGTLGELHDLARRGNDVFEF